jgi:hypothetical protein
MAAKLHKLPKPVDIGLIDGVAAMREALSDPNTTGCMAIITYKNSDGIEDTKFISTSTSNFKNLYLNKILEQYIMGFYDRH